MAKKDLIEQITVNGCGCFRQDDVPYLAAIGEDRLQKIVDNMDESERLKVAANAATEGFVDPVGNKHAFIDGEWESVMADDDGGEDTLTGNAAPQTDDEWFAHAPESVQRIVANALKVETDQKAALAEKLTVNLSGEQKKRLTENLMTKSLDELNDLALLAPAKAEPRGFNLTATPVTTNSTKTVPVKAAPLTLPTINWHDGK